MELTMNVPPRGADLVIWANHLKEAAERLNEFTNLMRFFGNREIYDCRARDGHVIRDHEFRFALIYGNDEERVKGFFHPGDEREYVKPYAMTTNIDDKLPIPSLHREYTSPAMPAYTSWVADFDIQPASHIYILRGAQSAEAATFFFPIRWGTKDSLYLMYSIGGRYSESHAHLFDGDPAKYAAENRRGPRSGHGLNEVDLCLSDRRNEWTEHPCHTPPNHIPLRRQWPEGTWDTPCAVMPCDMMDALLWLKTATYDEDRYHSWLSAG